MLNKSRPTGTSAADWLAKMRREKGRGRIEFREQAGRTYSAIDTKDSSLIFANLPSTQYGGGIEFRAGRKSAKWDDNTEYGWDKAASRMKINSSGRVRIYKPELMAATNTKAFEVDGDICITGNFYKGVLPRTHQLMVKTGPEHNNFFGI